MIWDSLGRLKYFGNKQGAQGSRFGQHFESSKNVKKAYYNPSPSVAKWDFPGPHVASNKSGLGGCLDMMSHV